MLKRPKYVSIDVAILTAKFFKISDIEKRLEWVSNFILALAGEAEDDYAAQVVKDAQVETYKEYLRKWKNVIVKNLSANGNKPTDEQIYNALVEEHGEEYLEALELISPNGGRPKKNGSAKQPVTDAPNGNAGENYCNGGATSASAILESANIRDENTEVTTKNQDGAGDATTRKDVEDSPMRGSVAISSQQLKTGTSSAPSTLADLANNVKSKKEAEESEKEAFGEFKHVLLTNEEWWKLATKLGKDGLKKSIEKLDTYLENNPKKLKGKGAYKSHYAAIIQWTADAVAESDKKKADAAAAEKRLENAQNNGQKYMTAAEKQLMEAKKTAEVVRKIREEAALKEAEVIIRG